MTISSAYDTIGDLYDFIDGLQGAARGVMRVMTREPNRIQATGWLITNTLIVTINFQRSGFPVNVGDVLDCFLSWPKTGTTVHAELLWSALDGVDLSLLQMRDTPVDRALRLDLGSPNSGQPVILLHYPAHRENSRLQYSLGRVVRIDGPWLLHDADTYGGSSGGAILSAVGGGILAMQFAGVSFRGSAKRLNSGVTTAGMLRALRASPAWEEIARYHKLANLSVARSELTVATSAAPEADSDLLEAALCWSFNPEELSAKQRERLEPLVGDPKALRWSLRGGERQRLIGAAGSLEALRRARGEERRENPGQKAIDRILEGPPYWLEEVEEEALPYWLQAVRWFAGVVPDLPSPADVNLTLERRRVRSRLLAIAGPDFHGRDEEITCLRSWFEDDAPGPMVITGIGGIGKSSLVARFATELALSTLLLWIDFDRADLAPDDATSVLGLLAEQVAVQVEGFTTPELNSASWEESADAFGTTLASRLSGASSGPLLVLDGFEVAQHVERHQEIWPLLERLLAHVPAMRVVVSGRAPVLGLKVGDRPATALHLTGLAASDAREWLRAGGINDADVLDRILEISRGVPLRLKLALRLLEAGGEVRDLPETFPRALIDGYLYRRILDRVVDPSLKPIARDALMLRRLTPEMVVEILGDRIPEGLPPEEVFLRLSREMALVETPGGSPETPYGDGRPDTREVLRLRPAVRSATLRLLELEDAARVREIDTRAACWYGRQDGAEVKNVAELVYHSLRLGDIEGAERAWRDDCVPLLLWAEEDLPEAAESARAWLRARLTDAKALVATLSAWEMDAAGRVRVALGRGLLRAVPQILGERQERSEASPLTIYDAWMQWRAGDYAHARQMLTAAREREGATGRDQAVIGAMMAAESGDRVEADALLEQVGDETGWADRPDGPMEALVVRAARVRLTVDLQAEMDLSEIVETADGSGALVEVLRRVLAPGDVMLPSLSEIVGQGVLQFWAPVDSASLEELSRRIEVTRRLRWRPHDRDLPRRRARLGRLLDNPTIFLRNQTTGTTALRLGGGQMPGLQLGMDLAELGRRRWRIAATSPFLAEAVQQATRTESSADPLRLAVADTLAAFRGLDMGLVGEGWVFANCDAALERTMRDRPVVPPQIPLTDRRAALARSILRREARNEPAGNAIGRWLDEPDSSIAPSTSVELSPQARRNGLNSLLLYLLGPDPLEMLWRRILGLPDTLPACVDERSGRPNRS